MNIQLLIINHKYTKEGILIQGARKKRERFEFLKNIMLIYATVQHE